MSNLATLLGTIDVNADGEVTTELTKRIVYKHNKIASFATGEDGPGRHRFVFRDHLLVLSGPESQVDALNEEFLKLAKGLMMVDQINIVLIKQLDNEVGLNDLPQRAVRGVVQTTDVADRQVEQMPGNEAGLSTSEKPNQAPGVNAPVKAPGFSFLKQS